MSASVRTLESCSFANWTSLKVMIVFKSDIQAQQCSEDDNTAMGIQAQGVNSLQMASNSIFENGMSVYRELVVESTDRRRAQEMRFMKDQIAEHQQ